MIRLVNSFYSPWPGGAERYVSCLSEALVAKGHQVTVYCSEKPGRPGESIEEGVRVCRMRTPLMFYGTPLTLPPDAFFCERFDVIHANFPGPYLAAMSSLKSVANGTPAVITWHNDLPSVTSAAALVISVHNIVSPLYLDRFKRIIATTEVYARRSRTLRRNADKVVVIPAGVDTEKFDPELDGGFIRNVYGLKGPVVLFVGALTRWHTYKGLDVLLNAFRLVLSQVPDARLLVVGGGSMRLVYEQLAATLGIGGSVTFAGRAEDSTLPFYYAASDLLVLPSKDSSEGFGLVLLEAMATGKPVIGSRVGGVEEVIRDGCNGLLVGAGDPIELGMRIISLLADEELRMKLGSNGRKFAETRSWSKVAEMVKKVYDSV